MSGIGSSSGFGGGLGLDGSGCADHNPHGLGRRRGRALGEGGVADTGAEEQHSALGLESQAEQRSSAAVSSESSPPLSTASICSSPPAPPPWKKPWYLPGYAFGRTKGFVKRLVGTFSIQFVVLIFLAYCLVKGTLFSFLETANLPYFQSYLQVSGERYHDYLTIATLPWSMKAIFATISDVIPVRGYHKSFYIATAGVLAAISLTVLAAGSFTAATADTAAMFFFFSHMGVVVVDLLCEGQYAARMRQNPHSGMTGQLVAAFTVGFMADAGYIRQMFWICVPLAAQIVMPVAKGSLQEERREPPVTAVLWDKLRLHKRVFSLAACMAVIAMGLVFVALYGNGKTKLVYSLLAAVVLCTLSLKLMPRTLALANMYMFLAEALYIQVSGVGQFFLTAGPECLPDGPHFSYVFFQTTSSIVEAIFGAIGVALFQTVFSGWRFQSIFWTTTSIRVFASAFDIILIQRWNRVIGISDEVMFLIGDRSLYKIAYMLDFMPMVVLTSKLCPRNMESTVYALLAGYQNFGQAISKALGAYFIEAAGIRAQVPCDFTHFGTVLTIGHMLLPLLVMPLTFFMIPNANLTDDLSKESEEAARAFGIVQQRREDQSEEGQEGSQDDDRPLLLVADSDEDDAL